MKTREEVERELEDLKLRKKDLEDLIYSLMERLEEMEQEEKSKQYMDDLWKTVEFAKDKLNGN